MSRGKLVYTSDPEEARRLRESEKMPEVRDASPAEQKIRVALDRKRRKGKTVTVASGFRLTPASLDKIARELKQRCGAGGTAKGDEVEIQGDHVTAVIEHLRRAGFQVSG